MIQPLRKIHRRIFSVLALLRQTEIEGNWPQLRR